MQSSSSSKKFAIVAILIVIIVAIYMVAKKPSSSSVSQMTNTNSQTQAMGAATNTTPVSSNPVVSQVQTNGNSDASLEQDSAAIDAQLQGFSSDSSAAASTSTN